MIRNPKTLKDVVEWGLCTGCGACRYASGNGHVKLVNIESVGIRPSIDPQAVAGTAKYLDSCPGYSIDATRNDELLPVAPGHEAVGPALEIWEGYATDPEIRYQASSGGVLSALALYCLEREDMGFVLHSGSDPDKPWMNSTVQSRNRSDILRRAGSRYAPASPCDGLAAIEQSDRPCVFIGKPCDTAAVNAARQQRPDLDRNLGLVLSFFCAGTPSTRGTLDLVKELNVLPESVTSLRYRGKGWPGRFTVVFGDEPQERSYSYEESWGKLSHYRSLRCQVCPDGIGRVADVTCGDAWDDHQANGDAGRSIVIVRTARGREIVRRAMMAGYITLSPATSAKVVAAQPNLVRKHREVFGRLLALRLFGIPVPRFQGYSLFTAWMRLPLTRRARTVLGTVKRILKRSLWRRRLTLPV